MSDRHNITEAEIIDVVLGDSDAELKSRVLQAMKHDAELVALYNHWEKELKPLQTHASNIRRMSERVQRGVMNRMEDVEFDPEVLHDSGEMGLSEDRSRWYHKASVIGLTAACLFLVVLGGLKHWSTAPLGGVIANSSTATIAEMKGNVVLVASVPKGINKYVPMAAGEKISFPSTIEVREESSLHLVFENGTTIKTEKPVSLRLETTGLVKQNNGRATYRVVATNGKKDFTVQIPQGNIVDLGTEFEVAVPARDSADATIDVLEGSVLVSPNGGGNGVKVIAGQKALMNTAQAIIQEAPGSGTSLTSTNSTPEGKINFDFQPQHRVFGSGSSLAQFVKPRSIALRPYQQFAGTRKLPPFTSSAPMMGMLRVSSTRGKMIEATLAVDKKLDEKWRIYFDVNQNNDLTDDPVFVEGVDFNPGVPFAAGTLDEFGAAWIEMPVEVVRTKTSTETVVPGDRLEFYNMNYIHAELDIPPRNQPGEEDSFVIFDHDSDGDFGDSDGSFISWVYKQNDTQAYKMMAMAPIAEPLYYQGYRWKLTRQLSGDGYHVEGEGIADLKPMPRPGNVLPDISSVSTSGDMVDFESPGEGMLLILAWSTWHSECRDDVAAIVRDIYPKYHDRGLSMVGISLDYDKGDLLDYMRENNISYPQVFNGPNQYEGITGSLGIRTVPTALLIDSQNTIVSVDMDLESLVEHLEQNLPAK